MKFNLKYIFGLLILSLIGINIYFFVKTVALGDTIVKTEREINKLRIENSEMEKKLYSLNSLQNLRSLASNLGFTKESEPIYLDNLKYALAK